MGYQGTVQITFTINCGGAGTVRVTNQTTGFDLDPDGFQVKVVGASGQLHAAGQLDVNGEVTLTSIPTGAAAVELGGVAANCQVEGSNSRPVTVTPGTTVDVAFAVTCTPQFGNLLVDPGFEGTVKAGPPTAPGLWSGDLAAIVLAEQGIAPADGTSMLRFLASSAEGSGYESDSEVFQLVDVRAFRAAIDGGQVKADAAVRVNRIAGPPSDTRFELNLRAFQGDCSSYPPSSYVLNVETNIIAEDELNTWEPLTLGAAGVAVPPGTDCLVFIVVARENRINETTGTEFVGQYADMAELKLRIGGQ